MRLSVGVKTDPIEYRYSYDWLFDLLQELSVRYVQLGSFFELYSLDEAYFIELRRSAETRGISIKSCFTSHRELGGFFTGNPHFEKTARAAYERLIHVASLLGADYAGSNPGSVYRDRLHLKQEGIHCYLRHMKELVMLAHDQGLRALTLEPMSCAAEPPASPSELDYITAELDAWCALQKGAAVPLYVCGDISHGYADAQGLIIHDNMDLFAHQIPHMAEFHFKNTDGVFNATFGFSPEEQARGRVNLTELNNLIKTNASRFPVDHVVGYFETGGPKLGRDYTDWKLEGVLRDSLTELQRVFGR